jgi:hypothetical protein
MGTDENEKKRTPEVPIRRGLGELWIIGITCIVIGCLFWVPRDAWLALNCFLFIGLFHYLAWREWKKNNRRRALQGFLLYLGPIYLGIIVISVIMLVRKW